MVKIRLQGTTNEIKRMRRVIERNRNLRVVSVSDVFANKGTSKTTTSISLAGALASKGYKV